MPEASQAGLDGVNADMHGHCHRGFRLAHRAFHLWTSALPWIGIFACKAHHVYLSDLPVLLCLSSRRSSLTLAPVYSMECSINHYSLKTTQFITVTVKKTDIQTALRGV